jgi:hypothetical protein
LIVGGKLVTNGSGYTLTYQAVADPDGSFNSTAMGKGNYYTFATALYGASLAPEGGLAGWSMPGTNNTPQGMLFEQTNHPAAGVATLVNWFRAEGIPISPYDDSHNKNPYPLMRVIARNTSNQPIATNDIVLPVSDEMDCRACHASGMQAAAKPSGGWVWNGLPERDFRLNILRLHDEHQFAQHASLYTAALAARGFNPQGLYRGVLADGKPVLCASCHASEALGAPSYGSIPPLTASVHSKHATVTDPKLGVTLDNESNRSACYQCHPGSATRCLRGAMGGAIAADGSMKMQCLSCHGNMSTVGSSSRVGWFMEPNCQSCHSGTAAANSGQIRYTSVFTDTNGTVRVATNLTFATNPNTPAPGISLYRFSAGHGGLQCSACHGSTHAEFPSTHRNDNLRNISLQGHGGTVVECTTCHTTMPNSGNGGPHGMHALGQGWVTGTDGVTKHADMLSSLGGAASCKPCHGTDYRGTVLSRAQANRTINVSLDSGSFTLNLQRGAVVGCYNCHNGPSSSSLNTNAAPTVASVSTNTTNDKAVAMTIPFTGNGSTISIISQPANGAVGLTNDIATYFPAPGFTGTEMFTYLAFNGAKNSTLATGTVTVAQGSFSIAATAVVPPSYPVGWPVAFGVYPVASNNAATVTFDWNFGDGSAHGSSQFDSHAFATAGSYNWTIVSRITGSSTTNTGTIVITDPVEIIAATSSNQPAVAWPSSTADVILEMTGMLGPAAQWTVVTNAPVTTAGLFNVSVGSTNNAFFRLRRPW